jgi:hypothetical protein
MANHIGGMTIVLDTIPDDPNNELAMQELQKIPGITIRRVVLPAACKGYVRFPNMSLPGKGHEPPALKTSGLDGIRLLVRHELKRCGR